MNDNNGVEICVRKKEKTGCQLAKGMIGFEEIGMGKNGWENEIKEGNRERFVEGSKSFT